MGSDRHFDVVSRDSYDSVREDNARLRAEVVQLKQRLTTLNDEETLYAAAVEALAAWDHNEAWSGWHHYYADKWRESSPDEWRRLMDRWNRQARTSYAELSEGEKESDRKEARRILAVLFQAFGIAATSSQSTNAGVTTQ